MGGVRQKSLDQKTHSTNKSVILKQKSFVMQNKKDLLIMLTDLSP